MGFTLDINISAISVFMQGLLSFFSPCVLPLIPLYMGYLSGGTMKRDESGNLTYKKSKVMINTFCFVVGISFAFVLLGTGVSVLSSFFEQYQTWITRVGGILIILLGLYQIGIFGNSKILGNTHKLPLKVEGLVMSPATALIMGFTFSFAWTPCVGPALTSVLLMTASLEKNFLGFVLIIVYTLGFVSPFLLVGLFTTSVLNFYRSHIKVVKYTTKIGGVIMLLMGTMLLTGVLDTIADKNTEQPAVSNEQNTEETDKIEETVIMAPDFTLKDQYGNIHTLSEYKGKTVFINFWATWCSPCRQELPHIQTIYEDYEKEGEEALIVFGIVAPEYGDEKSEEDIIQFVQEQGYTFPVLMDSTAEVFRDYGVSAFPTTFMIDKDGAVYGYVTGQLTEEIMHNIIAQTMGKE